jgi:hypothetical protein
VLVRKKVQLYKYDLSNCCVYYISMLVAKKNVLYEILNAANTENIYLNGRMCQPNTDALL